MSASSTSGSPQLVGTPSDQPIVRIGTRGSKLAVTQTTIVAQDLARLTGRQFEIVKVTTHGDVNRASLSTIGGQGVFATELREALRAGEVDIAVHSLKDLPTAPAPGLRLAAHPAREDARDAVVARDGLSFAELPQGAKVGTGSPRRRAQIRRIRPDIELRDIRGNVDTRIAFVTDGELDAVLLATAGLKRVDRTEVITDFLELEDFPTAPGQGALAIETRDDWDLPGLRDLDDAPTRAAADSERAILNGLDAGCQAPVGIYGEVRDGVLRILARVYGKDALAEARGEVTVDLDTVYDQSLGRGRNQISKQDYAPTRLAAELVESLYAQGAADLIGE